MKNRTVIEKPGKKKKKSHKIKPPVEKHCRKCGVETGTECWRHAESRIIKFESGGGIMGGKIPDDQTSWLCMSCDSELSQPLPRNATQKQLKAHAAEWYRLIELSH